MGRLLWALRTGIFTSGGLVLIGTGLAIWQLDMDFNLFWVVVVGLVTGQVIGTATEVFTSYEYPFTRGLSKQALTGPATVIIGGIGLGMFSTVIPIVSIVVAIWLANWLAGVYGDSTGRCGDAFGRWGSRWQLTPTVRLPTTRGVSPSKQGFRPRSERELTLWTRWVTQLLLRARDSRLGRLCSPR